MSGRGDKYLADGAKALNRSTIFGFGKSQKYEDAAEAFKNAGNAFKMENSWQSAGQAFVKAAEAVAMSESSSDAVNHYVEAANCFKKISPVDAIENFMTAVKLYGASGRFGMCARYYKEIAEIYEADHNTDSALGSYEQAADYFVKDNKQVNANQCLLKVATFASDKGDVIRAADIFASIGKESLSSRLGAFSAKGYFFQALLCHLASGKDSCDVNCTQWFILTCL